MKSSGKIGKVAGIDIHLHLTLTEERLRKLFKTKTAVFHAEPLVTGVKGQTEPEAIRNMMEQC